MERLILFNAGSRIRLKKNNHIQMYVVSTNDVTAALTAREIMSEVSMMNTSRVLRWRPSDLSGITAQTVRSAFFSFNFSRIELIGNQLRFFTVIYNDTRVVTSIHMALKELLHAKNILSVHYYRDTDKCTEIPYVNYRINTEYGKALYRSELFDLMSADVPNYPEDDEENKYRIEYVPKK